MRIGIDLGGTKIEGIAIDNAGTELFRKRIDSPQGDYANTLNAITNLINEIEIQTKTIGSVGLGIPGTISPQTGLVKNANSTWLIGQPLQSDLELLLKRKIRIENDANCFVVSEATDGAAKDAEIVFGVIIGTGTGGGIYIRGQSIIGANAIAGEWGHNPLPWPTKDELFTRNCYCGKKGCIETWLAGPGFVADHNQYNNTHVKTAKDIINSANSGDTVSLASLQRYELRLAKSLASIINVIDPDVIVLGGGMSNINSLYSNVPKLWGDYVFSNDYVETKLVPPKHGDSSGVRGAAWLWNN